MKRAGAALVMAWVLGATPSFAQTYPAIMTITAKEVEVRSGPTTSFHPTIKLKAGDRVMVRHPSKDQPTWLAIVPPQGSFSWINAKNVRQLDGKSGFAIGDPTEQITLLPGSSLVSAAPNAVSWVKVKPGYQFAILGAPLTNDGNTWLPITPHPEEDRFIPADAVLGGGNSGIVPVGASNPTTLITQANQAYVNGNLEQAKALYKEAAERTSDYEQKSYCYSRLASLNKNNWTTTQPGNPSNTNGPPAQLASRTNPVQDNPATQLPASWSKWGILRSTAFDKDGQPMYVLESDRGQPLLYVTTAPGFSLRGYLGKMVAVYGPTNYNNQIRAYYLTATHVAENNR